MAYSNVGVPVFYIDNFLYHKTIGTNIQGNIISDIYKMKPQIATQVGANVHVALPVSPINYNLNNNMKYYIALLNHNITNFSLSYDFEGLDTFVNFDFDEILNGLSSGESFVPLNGSTILTTSTSHDTLSYKLNNTESFNIGTISSGIQYTMPHSPDLDLAMEIEMDGIKTITTSGGGSISNIRYSGNPLWINGNNKTNCFDNYVDNIDVNLSGARRNGRKLWELSFTYVSDKDLFSSNPRASSYIEPSMDVNTNTTDYDLDDIDTDSDTTQYNYNIETDDSFYAQVWNKTLGGALPFIFQPNSEDRDDFYICKFNQKSLKISQSAYKVYDVKLKIEEIW